MGIVWYQRGYIPPEIKNKFNLYYMGISVNVKPHQTLQSHSNHMIDSRRVCLGR